MEGQLSTSELQAQGPEPGESLSSYTARLYATLARERKAGGELSASGSTVQAGGELATRGYYLTYVDQPRPAAAA